MFHPAHILLQSRPFDKNSINDKFSDLVSDVLAQVKSEHLDRLVHSVDKHISDIDIQNDLIDGIVRSRCNSLKKMFSDLSINEKFFILAHVNLDLISPPGVEEELSPIFMNLVSELIRQLIITG